MNPTAPKILGVSDRRLKDAAPYAKLYEYTQTRILPQSTVPMVSDMPESSLDSVPLVIRKVV